MLVNDPQLARLGARSGLVGLVAVLALVVAGFLLSQPATAQDPTGRPAGPVPTSKQLLAGPSTAVPTTAAPGPVASTGAVKTKSADTKKVWAVVATLVAVAVCLFVLTLLYVRRTRPDPSARRPDPDRAPPTAGPRRAVSAPPATGRSKPAGATSAAPRAKPGVPTAGPDAGSTRRASGTRPGPGRSGHVQRLPAGQPGGVARHAKVGSPATDGPRARATVRTSAPPTGGRRDTV